MQRLLNSRAISCNYIDPLFQSDFIGKEALKEKAGRYREMSCTMLEVEVKAADPEGNHTVYLCGKV